MSKDDRKIMGENRGHLIKADTEHGHGHDKEWSRTLQGLIFYFEKSGV